MRITTSIVIGRPIREVFACASNPCGWREWIAGAVTVEQTWSGQLDVGTTFHQEASLASSWDDASWEVTEYEPPRVFACRWLGASCGAVRLLYEALGGTTRVTLSSEEAVGLFTRGPEVERAIRAQMEHDLAALKRLLEAREGGADHDDTRDHRATYQEGKDMREAGMGTRPAATRTHSLVR